MSSWAKTILYNSAKSTATSLVGKAAKYSFWTLLCFFGPQAVISTIGVTGLATAAVVTHSGLIEYTADKIISVNHNDTSDK